MILKNLYAEVEVKEQGQDTSNGGTIQLANLDSEIGKFILNMCRNYFTKLTIDTQPFVESEARLRSYVCGSSKYPTGQRFLYRYRSHQALRQHPSCSKRG